MTTGSDGRGFDSSAYIDEQTRLLAERVRNFAGGKLYLEIGGKFLHDGHASRVLPGFDPACKFKIISSLATHVAVDFIFCISGKDICAGRVWEANKTYEETLWRTLDELLPAIGKPKIAINTLQATIPDEIKRLEESLISRGYKVFHRYHIPGYPTNLELIVSGDGYGRDDYVETEGALVAVIGLGSSCGKLSTCLGQVYQDRMRGLDSGYAKYELFPIWNLPLRHPINIAYEAATADIGDKNVIDSFHEEVYGISSVNYNRDVDAFPILLDLIRHVAAPGSFMLKYRSPTDMGVNAAKCGIVNEPNCIKAAIAEIERRAQEYVKELGPGSEAVGTCQHLLAEARTWH